MPIAFLLSLWFVLVVLKESFTLGEATLISQLNVLQVYLFYLTIVTQDIRLSKLRSVIVIGIFGGIAIAGHILFLNYLICSRRKRIGKRVQHQFQTRTCINTA